MTGCIEPQRAVSPTPSAQPDSPIKQRMALLSRVIDYELRSAKRYRRFVSLLMLTAANRQPYLNSMLQKAKRLSDKLIDLDSECVIVMSETDLAGALTAVERYKLFCDNDTDLRFSVASFPSDGVNGMDLLVTVYRRLHQAKHLQWGAVVSAD